MPAMVLIISSLLAVICESNQDIFSTSDIFKVTTPLSKSGRFYTITHHRAMKTDFDMFGILASYLYCQPLREPMNFDEANRLMHEHDHLRGQKYHDTRKKQVDLIRELVVTPQDHPFYPEFIAFYLQTGSYQEASVKAHEVHQDDIIYTVKCILDDYYDIKDNREMHVIMDLKYVMNFIPVS